MIWYHFSQPLLQRLKNITVLIIQARLSSEKSCLHNRRIGMAAIPKMTDDNEGCCHIFHEMMKMTSFQNVKKVNDATCCVFRPAFGRCAPESWSKYFFRLFSTLFVHFKCFAVIFHLKSRKNVYPLKESTSICISTSFKE